MLATEQVPSDLELGFCPIARAARLLGDTWTLLIIHNLADGPRRFSELEQATGMSPRVLAGRLRELESQHMLTRTQYPEIPPRVEYELTAKGCAALPTLAILRAFGAGWLNDACSLSLDARRTRQPAVEGGSVPPRALRPPRRWSEGQEDAPEPHPAIALGRQTPR